MITSIADVFCTPIGPPLPKSRPPLQTQVSNTTNIRVPDRALQVSVGVNFLPEQLNPPPAHNYLDFDFGGLTKRHVNK
ncbi:hypothetical protein TNCV_4407121 [Trichonephila clavipes]|nr:hypothetical protein TNCV_4407121 [Trichonephila clavipes]